jgi:di/tricarboxylate transporter
VGFEQMGDILGDKMSVTFGSWFLIATPVSLLAVIVPFILLFVGYKMKMKEVPYNPVPIKMLKFFCVSYFCV